MNGVGKTAILEALFIHMGPMNPTLPWRVNLWRGLGTVEEWSGMLWRTLFWQFKTQSPINLVGTDSRGRTRSLTVSVVPFSAALAEDMPASMGSEFAKDLAHELFLEYRDENGDVTTVRGIPEVLKRGDLLHFQLKTDPPIAKAPFPGIFLNSWHQGPGDVEVQRFSDLRIKNQDHLVLEVLKFMEPRLTRLEILSPHGASAINGDLEGYDKPNPLSLLGDGVRRVTSLVLRHRFRPRRDPSDR